jgi:undecaprenyl diphosphate synthase
MLMRLLMRALRDESDKLHMNNVRVNAIGEIGELPREVQDELLDSIERTKGNTGLHLYLALSYSGRWDLTRAMKCIAEKVQKGEIAPESIDEKLIAGHLSTHGVPDPDLLVRTSGELRISNFLLWQVAYSEIYISAAFWPDFRRKELYEAIKNFQQRERRFGLLSEQVAPKRKSPTYIERIIKSVSG